MSDDEGAAEDQEAAHQQAREVQALVGVLGHLAGLTEQPRVNPDSDPVLLLDLQTSVDILADAQYTPPPLQLELLARLVRATSHPIFEHIEVDGLARKLVSDDFSDSEGDVADELKTMLGLWMEGTEPLGRMTLEDLENPTDEAITWKLHEDIRCSALTIRPGCGAVNATVKGIKALSVVTDMTTCKEFREFYSLIDPQKWPNCWLESFFFKSMDEVPSLPSATTPNPDLGGKKRTLLETVDFGLSMTGDKSQHVQTMLDVLYFWNNEAAPTGGAGSARSVSYTTTPPRAGASAAAPPVVTRSPAAAAGCTYDLNKSVDNKILVDQGFLLVEDIPGHGYRRYRTQKEVSFASGNLPPGAVCGFWSIATGLIMQFC